jgi:WD40 repeat protein
VWEFAQATGTLSPGTIWNKDTWLPTFLPARPILELGTLRHVNPVAGLAWSPDGRWLVTVSYEPMVRLWDGRGGQEPQHLTDEEWNARLGLGQEPAGPAVQFLADYHIGASSVVLRDAADGHPVSALRHDDDVYDVAIGPDGWHVATASADGTARVWDGRSGVELAFVPHGEPVYQVVWGPLGTEMASRSRTHVWVWDTSSGRMKRLPGERIYDSLYIFREGEVLGVMQDDEHVAQVWDVTRNRLLAQQVHHDLVNLWAFSRDGSLLATASSDETVRIWEARTGRSLAVLRPGDYVVQMGFSADGTLLSITTEEDKVTHVWRVRAKDLAARACQIAGRNLTDEEWNTYIGGAVPYRCTCPAQPPGEGTGLEACP